MTPTLLFYILIGILIINFVVDTIIDSLNAKRYNDPIPDLLSDVYNEAAYKKSQAYKRTNHRFSTVTSLFSLSLTLLFFFVDGFAYVNDLANSYSEHPIVAALLFFSIIIVGYDIINMPFSYYKTFVIEEKFGFNKTTKKTFVLDKIKGYFMMAIIGGGLLSLVIWFYQLVGIHFWWYAWILIAVFSLFMNMFYAKLIVPLFNRQTPLEEGPLKEAISTYADNVGFTINNIFVIDGSKRSTKANAYFSGFGREKRITLFDTLIKDLDTEEIVAVLAHEVGHYKKKHIIFNLVTSVMLTGVTLFMLSLFINSPLLSEALGVSQQHFHIGLIAFGILYSPISEVTGLIMNYFSRKFEYQADRYAKETYGSQPLISSLKKLSKNSLSNLTPHPLYVKMYYSHPTLLQRVKKLQL
jgi:STE24 endopeptidase